MPRESIDSRFPNRAPSTDCFDRDPRSAARVCSGSMRASPFAFAPSVWKNRDHSARSAWGCVVASPSLHPEYSLFPVARAIGQLPTREAGNLAMLYLLVQFKRDVIRLTLARVNRMSEVGCQRSDTLRGRAPQVVPIESTNQVIRPLTSDL